MNKSVLRRCGRNTEVYEVQVKMVQMELTVTGSHSKSQGRMSSVGGRR